MIVDEKMVVSFVIFPCLADLHGERLETLSAGDLGGDCSSSGAGGQAGTANQKIGPNHSRRTASCVPQDKLKDGKK